MGYNTDFNGKFKLDRPLTPEHAAYIEAFNQSRRMKRDAKRAEELPDPVRIAAGLPIGPEGAYFVGGGGFMGQENDRSVLDHNGPPSGQPGLWCQWTTDEYSHDTIEWDCGEKFYEYEEWLVYIIEHFLQPWGYVLNGEVEWRGEDWNDTGFLVVEDNVVSTKYRE